MKNKKASLIIDITKDIIRQYKEQLKILIQENEVEFAKNYRKDLIDDVGYLEYNVNTILGKYNDFIENVVVTDEYVEYTEWKEEFYSQTIKVPCTSSSAYEKENEILANYSMQILKELYIPNFSVQELLADVMVRMDKNSYRDGILDLEQARIGHKKFNKEGKYNTGEMNLENLLLDSMFGDYRERYIYAPFHFKKKDLVFDSSQIKTLIEDYISAEIIDKIPDNLSEQDNLITEMFKTLGLSMYYGNPNIDPYYSEYDSLSGIDYYYNLFAEPMKREYIKKSRTISTPLMTELENLQKTKNSITTLEQLNKEEQELCFRLMKIMEEKQKIIADISNNKLSINNDEYDSTFNKKL